MGKIASIFVLTSLLNVAKNYQGLYIKITTNDVAHYLTINLIKIKIMTVI
jgi:hypothetical protein